MTTPSHNWQQALLEEKTNPTKTKKCRFKNQSGPVEVEPVSTSLGTFSKNLSSDLQSTTPMTTYDHVMRHLKKETAKTTLVNIFMSANYWYKITGKTKTVTTKPQIKNVLNKPIRELQLMARKNVSKRLRKETFRKR